LICGEIVDREILGRRARESRLLNDPIPNEGGSFFTA
jgi:hypothetical protein